MSSHIQYSHEQQNRLPLLKNDIRQRLAFKLTDQKTITKEYYFILEKLNYFIICFRFKRRLAMIYDVRRRFGFKLGEVIGGLDVFTENIRNSATLPHLNEFVNRSGNMRTKKEGELIISLYTRVIKN